MEFADHENLAHGWWKFAEPEEIGNSSLLDIPRHAKTERGLKKYEIAEACGHH